MSSDDLFDINDIILEAQAEINEAIQDFMQELAAPQAKRMLQMQWAQMTAEQKELIRAENPVAFNQLVEYLGIEGA